MQYRNYKYAKYMYKYTVYAILSEYNSFVFKLRSNFSSGNIMNLNQLGSAKNSIPYIILNRLS